VNHTSRLLMGCAVVSTMTHSRHHIDACLTRPNFSLSLLPQFLPLPAGYSLNALVDFSPADPIEVIKHLLIGSEGTLGFVSQATYNTVPEWPHKASAFIVFPDVRAACKASAVLRNETAVDAVELFDR
jgi:FAD/FMN-containing dehydrogenase